MKKFNLILLILFVAISLFGQNVEIQGDATITGTVEVMDTILFSDGTELASACLQILQDTNGDTKIEVEKNPNEDVIRFTVDGNEIARFVDNRLEIQATGNSVFIGYNSGVSDDGTDNFITAVGNLAGEAQTSGFANTYVGASAGNANQTGNENTHVGTSAGYKNISNGNTMIGRRAGFENTNGSSNTFLGNWSGHNNNGSGNVFLGNHVGENESGSNKLVIDNSGTGTPLIYGDFSSNKLSINGPQMIGAANMTINDLDGSWGGIYVNTMANGRPFYGYSVNGLTKGWHSMDTNGNWILTKSTQAILVNAQNYMKVGSGTPLERLDVNGAIRIGNTSNSNLGTIRFNNGDFEGRLSAGWVSLSGSGSGSDNDWIEDGTDIYRASGNVGIGNTNPSSSLHVTGSSKFEGKVTIDNNDFLVSNSQGDSNKGLKFGANSTGLIGLTHQNNGAYNDKLHFKTFYDQVGESFMTLDGSTGNIGINNTSPIQKLHVNGNALFEGSIIVNESELAQKGIHSTVSGLSSTAVRGDATSNGNSTNYGGYFTSNGSNGHAVVGIAGSLVGNNFGGYFRAWGDNGVGIYANASGGLWSAQLFGNIEANGDLYLKSDTQGKIIMHGRAGLLGSVISRNNGDGVMYLGDIEDTGTDLHIMESGEEAITIRNGGNVGIGTISPNYALEIYGEDDHDHVVRIRNKADSDDADGLLIDLDYGSPGSENNFITFESNNNVAGRIEGFQYSPAGNYMDYPQVNFDDYINTSSFNSTLQAGEIILENLLSCIDPFECPPSPTFPFTPTCQECQDLMTNTSFAFNDLWEPELAADYINKIGPVFEWNIRNGVLDMANGPFDMALRASPEYWNRFAFEGDGGVTYGSKGADYAEWLEREVPSKDIKAGQIVGVKNGKISLETENADQIMAISVMPVVLGNMPDTARHEDFEKVAFIGQTPVWVVGVVESGDYIIASGNNDGFGIPVSQEEITIEQVSQVVGRAWEDGDKMINLVNMAVGLKTNEMATILSRTSEKVEKMEERLETIEAALGINGLAKK